MDDVTDSFNRSCREIEHYFAFLKPYLDPAGSQDGGLGAELQKILKAAGMLLLYNVVEATVRNGMLSVYDAVNAAQIDYPFASATLRRAWLDQRLRALDQTNTRYDTFKQNAHNLLAIVADRVALEFDVTPDKALELSGNVDARKIRELAVNHGIPLNEELTEAKGYRLVEVKNLRNRLAHGFLSFADCGRDLDWSDLEEAKIQVVSYLSAWLQCVDAFIVSLTAAPPDGQN